MKYLSDPAPDHYIWYRVETDQKTKLKTEARQLSIILRATVK
jgi:hypothetical protein